MKLLTAILLLSAPFSLILAVQEENRQGQERESYDKEVIKGEDSEYISLVEPSVKMSTRGIKRNFSDLTTESATTPQVSVVTPTSNSSSSSSSSLNPSLNISKRSQTLRRSTLALDVDLVPEPPLSSSSSKSKTPKSKSNEKVLVTFDDILKYTTSSSKLSEDKFFAAINDGFKFDKFQIKILFDECVICNRTKFILGLLKKGHEISLLPLSERIKGEMNKCFDSKQRGAKYKEMRKTLFHLDPSTFISYLNDFVNTADEHGSSQINYISGLEAFSNFLRDEGLSLDSEAIQVAAETASELGAFDLLEILWSSELMVRMVPQDSIIKLISSLPEDAHSVAVSTITLIRSIDSDRLITPKSYKSLLLLAAENNIFKLLPTLDFQKQSWSDFFLSIYTALKLNNLKFAEILASYHPLMPTDINDAFKLVNCGELLEMIIRMNRLSLFILICNLRLRDQSYLVNDNAYLLARKMALKYGRMDFIKHLFFDGLYYNGDDVLLKDKFLSALKTKNYILAKFLINNQPYLVYTSLNSVNMELGDTLQCVNSEDPESVSFFSYMLFLGFNPNPIVCTQSETGTPLIYWLININRVELVKLLLNHKECHVDYNVALSYCNENDRDMINLLKHHFQKG